MVIEEGLNQLPYTEVEVTTPTGCGSQYSFKTFSLKVFHPN